MDSFKLEIFNSKHPGQKFEFISLNMTDTNWVISAVLDKVNLIISNKLSEPFFKQLLQTLDNIIPLINESIPQTLKEYFHEHSVSPDSLVFIIWDIDQNADLLTSKGIISHWDDIWYGPSDEAMVIFIPSISKILLLADYGLIKSN